MLINALNRKQRVAIIRENLKLKIRNITALIQVLLSNSMGFFSSTLVRIR